MSFEKEEKYKINNLFVAYYGIKSSEVTHAKETIICKIKEDSWGKQKYTDILTGNTYQLNSSVYAHIGDPIVFKPVALMSIFKPSEYRNNILEKGYITKKEIINIYNTLNSDNGYVVTVIRKDIKFPEDCTVLNRKIYKTQPTHLREKELESLMISLALNKKIVLITGEHKVGKTALVDQLAYLIQHNQVPDFLKHKTILEINIPKLQIKEKNLDKKIKEIIEYAKENEAILFIDEADDILTLKEENTNVIAMLRYAAERENLKIITTINSNKYKEMEQNNDFQDKFEKINLKEPSEKDLIEIGKKVFRDKELSTKISIKNITEDLDNLVTTLIKSTESNSINLITNQSNPGLFLSIIDTSFAIAEAKNEKNLSYEHIIEAIERNNNLETSQVQNAIKTLKKDN